MKLEDIRSMETWGCRSLICFATLNKYICEKHQYIPSFLLYGIDPSKKKDRTVDKVEEASFFHTFG